MSFNRSLRGVEQYYSEKIRTYGATARGVDWNSPRSQELRFEQLLKVCDSSEAFTINDYGCGYGALVEYMTDRGYAFAYRGFDLSGEMIAKAKGLHQGLGHCQFFTDESLLTTADYTVASGVFNVKLKIPDEVWGDYMLQSLQRISLLSGKGFAFNNLTKYSDRDHMRSDLFYADPCVLFDYCKTKFSRHVSLLHDYGLYEFTILVRK